MKIETLTPQIAALYAGQKATRLKNRWDFTLEGVVGSGAYCVDGYVCPVHNIVLHLRPLSSLTESEARELYEMVAGEKWKQIFEKQADECLPLWVFDDVEDLDIRGIDLVIGSPAAWLHLLSLGFDLFGLIDAGLAKEITNP